MSEQSPISADGALLRVGDLVVEVDGQVTGEPRRGVVESTGISSTSNRPDGVLVRLPRGDVSSPACRWRLE